MSTKEGGLDLRRDVEELVRKRDQLRISNTEWANLTSQVDPEGQGIPRQTLVAVIYRENRIPQTSTLRLMRLALMLAEEKEQEAIRRIRAKAESAWDGEGTPQPEPAGVASDGD